MFAGGVLAIVISVSFMYSQAYFHKYLALENLDDPRPVSRWRFSADFLFLITFTMALIALFTTLQWPSLFPGLRDYLALAGLPLRMRDIFVAKFMALLAFASLTDSGVDHPAQRRVSRLMAGRYDHAPGSSDSRHFRIARRSAGFFVFFSLVDGSRGAAQRPARPPVPSSFAGRCKACCWRCCCARCRSYFRFPTCALYEPAPGWAIYAPPLWFLGRRSNHRRPFRTAGATSCSHRVREGSDFRGIRGVNLSVELSPAPDARHRIPGGVD